VAWTESATGHVGTVKRKQKAAANNVMLRLDYGTFITQFSKWNINYMYPQSQPPSKRKTLGARLRVIDFFLRFIAFLSV